MCVYGGHMCSAYDLFFLPCPLFPVTPLHLSYPLKQRPSLHRPRQNKWSVFRLEMSVFFKLQLRNGHTGEGRCEGRIEFRRVGHEGSGHSLLTIVVAVGGG